ncbi:hypothetical protein GLW08_09850 [Pontibacillus yanchengensis]|uniref:Uncharacterized protein n=1 Tax=Pontibacillus yanchengensis TaxID=462910 RepID=A0ACC7VDX6_9BACI|nr:hypothetical protein [Pontibacillus yanchengensis]MYL53638.1 hypothetical protein [Pontibacillus yanchengensis]
MEHQLYGKSGAYPCVVTNDPDNGRYMIRKEDTSGEVFNSKEELVKWIHANWEMKQFENPEAFITMMDEIEKE